MLGDELIPSMNMAMANRFGSRAVRRKKDVGVKPDGVKVEEGCCHQQQEDLRKEPHP